MKLYMNDEDINNEDIYVEIKNPTLCIICLEELDDNIKNICVNCNIKCHTKCLRKWYKSKRKHICPICLKTKRYYEKKKIENNETETQNISIVLNEENNIDDISEDELNEEGEGDEEEMDEEETGEEEVINYYLHRQNDRNICYRTVNELCCSRRTGSYLLIFCIIVYAYSITF